MNFRSKEAYKKWLAYGHIRGLFKISPGNQRITIIGKRRKVLHSR
jgi:hypothetical protein